MAKAKNKACQTLFACIKPAMYFKFSKTLVSGFVLSNIFGVANNVQTMLHKQISNV